MDTEERNRETPKQTEKETKRTRQKTLGLDWRRWKLGRKMYGQGRFEKEERRRPHGRPKNQKRKEQRKKMGPTGTILRRDGREKTEANELGRWARNRNSEILKKQRMEITRDDKEPRKE